MIRLPELGFTPASPFPPLDSALSEPNGLLAWGGDLTPTRLLNAYRHGIFPWYSQGEPILWWSPNPRCVFRTADFHLSRRDRRSLHQRSWRIIADRDFEAVVQSCASQPRPGQRGTWIDPAMQAAYIRLHQLGHAHSIEVRDADDCLVGGLYGIAMGRVFFGESMVSLESGGSKAALAGLCRRLQEWGFPLLDAQVESAHLMRLGATTLPRHRFADMLQGLTAEEEAAAGNWQARFGVLETGAL
ncbi:MAG: leucyl/phenylalanyl-tRNA--protein transferase [Lysobacteraceae bacterium]